MGAEIILAQFSDCETARAKDRVAVVVVAADAVGAALRVKWGCRGYTGWPYCMLAQAQVLQLVYSFEAMRPCAGFLAVLISTSTQPHHASFVPQIGRVQRFMSDPAYPAIARRK